MSSLYGYTNIGFLLLLGLPQANKKHLFEMRIRRAVKYRHDIFPQFKQPFLLFLSLNIFLRDIVCNLPL